MVLGLALGDSAWAADKNPRAAKAAKTAKAAAKAAPQAEGLGEPGLPAAEAPAASSAPANGAASEPAASDGGEQAEGGTFRIEVTHPMLISITGERTAVATGRLPVIEIDKSGEFSLEAGRVDLRNEAKRIYLSAWVTIRGRVDEKTGRVLSMKMDANCNAGRIGGAYEAYQLFADPNMEVGTTKAAAGSAAKFVLTGKFNGPIRNEYIMYDNGSRGEGRKLEDGRIEGQFETRIRGKMLARMFPAKPKGPKPVPAWAMPALIALGALTLGAAVGVRIKRWREAPRRPGRKASAAVEESPGSEGELARASAEMGVVLTWTPSATPRRRRRRRRAWATH